MKITKTQIRKIVKEALLKEAGLPHSMRSGRSMGDLDREAKMRETDYLSGEGEEEPPEDPLLAAATAAYHELAEWLDNPNADENTGRVIDQLAAAINNAGGDV